MRRTILFHESWYFTKKTDIDLGKAAIKEGIGRETFTCEDMEAVTLPHTWNAMDGQDGGNDYYRGRCLYVKNFPDPRQIENAFAGSIKNADSVEVEKNADSSQKQIEKRNAIGSVCHEDNDEKKLPQKQGSLSRVYLELEGAAMTAEVYLNGIFLKRHEGGYSTFRVELTEALKPENQICIYVDNRENDRVYPQKADFTFYGGIYRDVKLILTEEAHFALEEGDCGVKVTPKVDLEKGSAVLKIESRQYIWENGQKVRFTVFAPEDCGAEYWRDRRESAACSEEFKIVDVKEVKPEPFDCRGKNVRKTKVKEEALDCGEKNAKETEVKAEVFLNKVRLWDGLKDPYLYILRAELLKENGEAADCVEVRFGCRSFSFDKEKGFFLNGRSYPLRGVSRHQDRAGVGNALLSWMHEEDMDIIREIGATTVRLAHYQQAQYFYDLCDENGLVVWAEIPYITCHMPNGRENSLSQMRELVTQCCNHASIVCWGLSNEITASGTATEDLMENHRLLNDLCHKLDDSRPTTMAHVFMLETDSPLIDIADIGSYNLYFGWYLGELSQNDSFFDEYHEKFPNRIIGFSEYGADANPQFHSTEPESGDYTEEYQCVYHEHLLKCIEDRPYLWATHVWNLFDFAADGRDEGGKHGVNQKGLVTMDRKYRKDAFYLYKAAWKKQGFVHLCGKGYENRTEAVTQIKVYSNLNHITLKMDGKTVGEQDGSLVFTFQVPISTTHKIEAFGEADTNAYDCMTIQKVEVEDPSYRFAGRGNVVNWFDKDDIKTDCFSIYDTLGELKADARTAPIIGRLMAQASASRGDVAKSTAGNQNLERMMAGMKLETLLKKAGDAIKPEQAKALNDTLQKIKKQE